MTHSELTITVKDEEKTLKVAHSLHNEYTISLHDTTIQSLVEQALQQFQSESQDISVRIRINLEVQ